MIEYNVEITLATGTLTNETMEQFILNAPKEDGRYCGAHLAEDRLVLTLPGVKGTILDAVMESLHTAHTLSMLVLGHSAEVVALHIVTHTDLAKSLEGFGPAGLTDATTTG